MRRWPERQLIRDADIAKLWFGVVSLCLLASACGNDKSETPVRPPGPPVVVYAAGDAGTMQAMADAYSADSGISILLTTETSRALVDRISAEKHRSTADLVITDGVVHLWTAVERDILRPSSSVLPRSDFPKQLHDQENLWFALAVFARTIVYDQRAVNPSELASYKALGDSRWRKKLCLSSASVAGNQAQIAMMIAEHGDRATEMIVRSWIANLAQPVVADDSALLVGIDDGRCSLGIVNSDHAEDYARNNPDTSVAMFWPADSAGGTHVDFVGAAVTRHAGNPAGAKQLLEWLLSAEGQKLIGGASPEYQIGTVNLAGAGFYREDALSLLGRAHWMP